MKHISCEEKIEQDYSHLLKISEIIDSCYEKIEDHTTFGRGAYSISSKKADTYWTNRHAFEFRLAEWIKIIRECIDKIPDEFKRYNIESHTDPNTSESRYIHKYENKNFSSLIRYYEKVINVVEGYNGILSMIEQKRPLFDKMRNLRGIILFITHTIPLFVPEKIFDIEQYVSLIFDLKDIGLYEIAELLEEIDEKEKNIEKCLNVRTALEKYIKHYLNEKSLEIKKGFYSNLDNAIKEGLTEKQKRKTIASHYSYISKIIHKEIEDNNKNTQFAIIGILNILHNLLPPTEPTES